MRAVIVNEYGPPDVMRAVEQPEPMPGPNEVVIRTHTIGVNFHDLWARLGFPGLADLPFVQGIEVAGTIAAAGAAVDPSLRLGTRVIGLPLALHGAYAEAVLVPSELVFTIPDTMPWDHAAAFAMSFLTAFAALQFTARPRRGERVLVHAAAGSVGSAAVQLARLAGAEVFGTASAAKHDFLRDTGVDHAIDYRTADFAAEVTRITRGEGVDVILDSIGGESFARGLSVLRYGGRLVCYGISEFAHASDRLSPDAARYWSTASFPGADLLGGAKSVMGSHLGAPPAMLRAWMNELLELYTRGHIVPKIDRTYPLAEAAAAHHRIHQRLNAGKVLLVP